MKEKYEEELKAQEKMNEIQKTLADNTARKDKVCIIMPAGRGFWRSALLSPFTYWCVYTLFALH
jgi:hypothetical protein